MFITYNQESIFSPFINHQRFKKMIFLIIQALNFRSLTNSL